MTIKFDYLVADFYTVETMYSTLTVQRKLNLFPEFFGRRACDDNYPYNIELNRLWLELDEYRKTEHAKMATMLRDSCLGMAIGESRHATEFDRYTGEYEITDDDGLLRANGSRQNVYDNLSNFSLDDAHTLSELYDDGWNSSFGGSRWQDIADYVTRYDELDATTFVDVVVHAVHNGGCAFDKGLLVMVHHTGHVQRMLDSKFQGSILDVEWLNLNRRVFAWLQRYQIIMARVLGIAVSFPSIEFHDDFDYPEPIKWNNEKGIHLEHVPDRVGEYCYDCDSYTCGCDDDDDDDYSPSNTYAQVNSTSDYSKTHKGMQEQKKKAKMDFDFKIGKITEPLNVR